MRLPGRSTGREEESELVGQIADEERGTAAGRPDHDQVGKWVAGVLSAAEEAAEQMRSEAEADANRLREESEEHADMRRREAAQHRTKVEEQARQTLADAEAEADATIKDAEQAARRLEQDSQRREDEIREEMAQLERHRQTALGDLRDIAAQLQDLLVSAPVVREDGRPPDTGEYPATTELGAEPETEQWTAESDEEPLAADYDEGWAEETDDEDETPASVPRD